MHLFFSFDMNLFDEFVLLSGQSIDYFLILVEQPKLRSYFANYNLFSNYCSSANANFASVSDNSRAWTSLCSLSSFWKLRNRITLLSNFSRHVLCAKSILTKLFLNQKFIRAIKFEILPSFQRWRIKTFNAHQLPGLLTVQDKLVLKVEVFCKIALHWFFPLNMYIKFRF
jgi:hypothetical protein